MNFKKQNTKKLLYNYYIVAIILILLIFVSHYYNKPLFHILNGLGSDYLKYIMMFLTAMGDGFFVLATGSLFFKKRENSYHIFIAAFILSGLIIQIIKYYFPQPRPLIELGIENIFYMGDPLTYGSFPSGHSASAMVIARYLMVNHQSDSNNYIYLAYGILISLSRVYIGVHFPVDIVVGALIGYFSLDILLLLNSLYLSSRSKLISGKYNHLTINSIGLVSMLGYLIFHYNSYPPVSMLMNYIAILFGGYFITMILMEFSGYYKLKNKS